MQCLALTLFTLILSQFAFSQVVINEYSASNLDSYTDDFSKSEDWIELYNGSDIAVDLNGWFLSDKETKPTKWRFPEGVLIPENGYLVVWCSGRDTVSINGIHTSFKLTQTKGNEVLTLTMPDETIVESIPMAITGLDHSRARETDLSENWVVAVDPTLGTNNIIGEKYSGYAEEPTMTLEAGFYTGAQNVTIEYESEDITVFYTTNGNRPTLGSTPYVKGTEISIQNTQVLKAKAFSTDPTILPGKEHFRTYFINESFSLPVFSVSANGIKNLANGQGSLRPQGGLEYFNTDGEREAVSYGELNRHGQDSWILPHRSIDWISRDEMGYNKTVKAKLFNYSDRDDYQRFMFRASGDDNYPANDDFNHQGSCHIRDEYTHALAMNGGMKLDVRAVERVIVFLNGEYWGLYGLRERPVDHDYTAEYYDQGKYDLQYLATWGNTWAEYGGDKAFEDWGVLRDFILENSMFEEENYQIVKDNMQVKSLCDYMIVNLNTVASDWLNYNTGWWRGTDPDGDHKKWGYILWDNDATFDYYINYSGVPNTNPDATPCDIDEISEFMDGFFNNDIGKHEKIFLKLIEENDEFRQLYYSRQADMLNTVFSCENMLGTLDSMIATLEPEMPRQIERWGGSMNEWNENVATMRSFIEARCMLIDDGMVECFDLTGPYDIVLDVEPVGTASEIDFNTLEISSFPWGGEYFGNMPNLINAKSLDEDLSFLFWKTSNGSIINPDSSMAEGDIYFESEDTLIAVFGIATPVVNIASGTELSVYPTIIQDQFSVKFSLDQSEEVAIRILDVQGNTIQDFPGIKNRYSAGDYHFNLDLNRKLSAGVYLVQLVNENNINTVRVVIAK